VISEAPRTAVTRPSANAAAAAHRAPKGPVICVPAVPELALYRPVEPCAQSGRSDERCVSATASDSSPTLEPANCKPASSSLSPCMDAGRATVGGDIGSSALRPDLTLGTLHAARAISRPLEEPSTSGTKRRATTDATDSAAGAGLAAGGAKRRAVAAVVFGSMLGAAVPVSSGSRMLKKLRALRVPALASHPATGATSTGAGPSLQPGMHALRWALDYIQSSPGLCCQT
jgi:hypothetical protein